MVMFKMNFKKLSSIESFLKKKYGENWYFNCNINEYLKSIITKKNYG